MAYNSITYYIAMQEKLHVSKKLEDDIRCPLEYGLKVFGGKWKSRIICVLADEKSLRYGRLRQTLCNITDAVLAATLKELIADGLIMRKSFDEIPPHVEYSLTPKGRSVVPLLRNICKWAGLFYRKTEDTSLEKYKHCDYTRI